MKNLVFILLLISIHGFSQKKKNETIPSPLNFDFIQLNINSGDFIDWVKKGSNHYYEIEWKRETNDGFKTYRMIENVGKYKNVLWNSNVYKYWFEPYTNICYAIELDSFDDTLLPQYLANNGFLKTDTSFYSTEKSISVEILDRKILIYPIPKINIKKPIEEDKFINRYTNNYELTFDSFDKYLTQFTSMRLNFVLPRIEGFLLRKMQLTHAGESDIFKKDSTIIVTQSFHQNIRINEKERNITFRFELKEAGEHELIIKNCEISGNYDLVVWFFIAFWPTTLNFDDVEKNELVTSYYYQDRASLTPYLINNKAKIDVVKR